MLTYRQFLFEKTFEQGYHDDDYAHHAEVGHRKVKIEFSHEHEKQYGVNFYVDGHVSDHKANQGDKHENRKILHHVHRVLHSFIKEKNPKALRFSGTDTDRDKESHKDHVYGKLADHLAHHYGGEAEHDPGEHHVHFRAQ